MEHEAATGSLSELPPTSGFARGSSKFHFSQFLYGPGEKAVSASSPAHGMMHPVAPEGAAE